MSLTPSPASDRFAPLWWLWVPLAFMVLALVTANTLDPEIYKTYIDGEQGLMELTQALTTAAALVIALLALRDARRAGRGWLVAYLALAALCCLYVTGEEISWGQTLVGWATPEGWAAINDQEETNLHNLGAWGNELPRHALSASVIVGGLLVPLLELRWDLRRGALGLLLPPRCLWLTALLSALGGLLREKDWIGGLELLPRASEVQESFLFWFVLLYLIALRRRIRAL